MQSLRRQRFKVDRVSSIRRTEAIRPAAVVSSDGISFAQVLKEAMIASQQDDAKRSQKNSNESDEANTAKKDSLSVESTASGEAIVKGWSPFADSDVDLHEQLESLLNKKSALIGIA
jgi:hypothetical protein